MYMMMVVIDVVMVMIVHSSDGDDYVQLTLCFIRSTSSVVNASDFDITGITFTCFVATIHIDNVFMIMMIIIMIMIMMTM